MHDNESPLLPYLGVLAAVLLPLGLVCSISVSPLLMIPTVMGLGLILKFYNKSNESVVDKID